MSYVWESPCPMPSKRVFSTPVELDDKMYVLGGCDVRGTPLGNMERYDPVTNAWTKLDDMPTKRAGTCAVVVGKKIVALGGIDTSQQPLDKVEIFDTEKNSWTTGEALPEHLFGLSGVVRDNRVMVVGGMGKDTNPRDSLLEYDINTNKWKKLPSMPTPRYATYSFMYQDKFYVLGGRQGKTPVRSFEVYDLQEKRWTKLADVPSARVFAMYVHKGNQVYSLGGLTTSMELCPGFTDVTEIYDIEKGEWKVASPMLNKRGDFAAGILADRLVVAGGLGDMGVPLDEAEVYDNTSDTWTSLPDLPSSHCSCAHFNFRGRFYIIGGLSVGGPTGDLAALSLKN